MYTTNIVMAAGLGVVGVGYLASRTPPISPTSTALWMGVCAAVLAAGLTVCAGFYAAHPGDGAGLFSEAIFFTVFAAIGGWLGRGHPWLPHAIGALAAGCWVAASVSMAVDRWRIRRTAARTLLRLPPSWALGFSRSGHLALGLGTSVKVLGPDHAPLAEHQGARNGVAVYQYPAIAFDPEGRRLAYAADDALHVLDWADDEVVLRLDRPGARVRAIGFSASGERLVVVTSHGAQVLDTKDGRVLAELSAEPDSLDGGAISADGSRVAILDSKRLRRLDAQLAVVETVTVDAFVHTVVFVEGGVAWAAADGIHLRDASGERTISRPGVVALAAVGRRLAMLSDRGWLEVLDLDGRARPLALHLHGYMPGPLALSHDGARAASSEHETAVVRLG